MKKALPKLRIPERSLTANGFEEGLCPREAKVIEMQADHVKRQENMEREDLREKGGLWALFGKALALLLLWNSKHHVKHVQASPHVLCTYHNSLLYGDLPLSGRFRTFIRRGNIRYVWYVLELNLTILSGVLYVYSTYYVSATKYVKNIQDVISLVFFFDYVLRVFWWASILVQNNVYLCSSLTKAGCVPSTS